MINVFVADDHPVVREGLKRLLVDLPDVTISGEADSGDDVLEELTGAKVDVLLLDVSMPGPGFVETIRRLRGEHPSVHVLVLSVHPEDQYARRAHEVLCLLGGGMATKEIAAKLDVSPKTVSTYRTRLLEKLNLKTTADLSVSSWNEAWHSI